MHVLTKPPVVGEYIPSIDLVSPDGRPSTLPSAMTDRGAIIYFMRTATCPVCNAHVKNLARLSANNELYGFKPIIVVPGSPKDANRVATRHGTAHVEVWSSEEGHETFGLHIKAGMIQQSGTWVVDGEREVIHTTTSTIPIQGLNHQAVRETAAVLAGRDPQGASALKEIAETRTQPPARPESAPADQPVAFVLPRSSMMAPEQAAPERAPAEASVTSISVHADRADATLGRIVGVDLRAVAFSADYIQMVFGTTTVSCFDWPAVHTPNGTFDIGDPGYRDALCSYIGSPVAAASVDSRDGLRISFGDAAISIDAAPEQTNAAAAMVVDLKDGVNATWYAGAPAFAPST